MTRENQAVQKSTIPAETDLEGHPWPDAVRFVPYWGDLYGEGIQGKRVLLLGESHYREAGIHDPQSLVNALTKVLFNGYKLTVQLLNVN